MFPFFTTFAVLFIIVFTIGSRKNTAEQQKVQEAYWQREREANNVRKQDLGKLNYINISITIFHYTEIRNILQEKRKKTHLP